MEESKEDESPPIKQLHLRIEAQRAAILQELKDIWDEIGEEDDERERMLHMLEEECLNVFRNKVEEKKAYRAHLHKKVADSIAEIAAICAAMGDHLDLSIMSKNKQGCLKGELRAISRELEEMRRKKEERKRQFDELTEQMHKMLEELGSDDRSHLAVDESDLSLKKHQELRDYVEKLETEKADHAKRIRGLLDSLHSLVSVLNMDSGDLNLQGNEGEDISSEAISRVKAEIERLRDIKRKRIEKVQDLVTTMLELWNLMDIPAEEQQKFHNVTCNIAASEHEITRPNALSLDFIDEIQAEVTRLEKLKDSRMQELVLKKKIELRDICKRAHLVLENEGELEMIFEPHDSGLINPSEILAQLELQISKAKEEEFSRKEILEKVEKWQAACEEESWLEEFNKDENRYNASKGYHLTHKRAEKARNLVSKIPAMVEALVGKITAWETESGTEFRYDGTRLVDVLEKYTNLCKEKDQERRKQRDERRIQGLLLAEQENMFGTNKSSNMKSQKKVTRTFSGGHGRKPALQKSRPSSPATQISPQSTRNFDDTSSLSSAG